MLVLSRRQNEAIRIGDDVKVTVVSIEGGVVKLGIEAPHCVTVHRGEIYRRIQAENRMAASRLPTKLSEIARHWRCGIHTRGLDAPRDDQPHGRTLTCEWNGEPAAGPQPLPNPTQPKQETDSEDKTLEEHDNEAHPE